MPIAFTTSGELPHDLDVLGIPRGHFGDRFVVRGIDG